MSGLIPGYAMKSAPALCRIVADVDGRIAKWVCTGLGESLDWVGRNVTMGVILDGRLIAGIIFNDVRHGRDVWLTIYSTDKRWCCRRVLRAVFNLAFDVMDCKRVSLFVSKDNEPSIKLVEGLGFVREGLLRQYRDNGQDCYVYGMLKYDCIWRSK